MNIQMQLGGIATLVVLLLFYLRHKKTHLVSERVFLWVLGSALGCLVLDAASVVVIQIADARDRLNQPSHLVVDYVSKFYLLTLLAIGISTLLYICADIYATKPKELEKRAYTYGMMGLIGMAVIFALPIRYERSAAGVITNTGGPSVYAAYIFIGLYLGLIAFHLIRDRALLSRLRLAAVLLWLGLWVGSFVAHLIDHSILLAGFACSVGVLVIYLALENPESNFDKASGLFNSSVLRSYLQQKYARDEKFASLLLIFEGPLDRGSGRNSAEHVRLAVSRYLESHKRWMAFKQSESRIFLVFNTPKQARAAYEDVVQFVAQQWPEEGSIPVSLRWVLVPDNRMVSSHISLLYLVRHLAHNHYFQDDLLEVDDKLVEQVRRDLSIEGLLDTAIKNDTIEVFFQPIYSTRDRRITSAEALVRIRDNHSQLIPPGMFIPIAEANGMILALGERIFEHVCRFIKAHPLEELGLDYVEINLSMIQGASAGLATTYIDIMRRFGVDPRYVNLEITESASTSTKKALLKNMDTLINYGVTFSLDDFGTGQSNLDYIMDLPVKIAKFDRSMTQAYFSSQRAKQVMTAAIRMIHDMGLSIVSEGVETEAELRAVEALGVEYVQGYYFSKPLSESDFLAYLRDFRPPEHRQAI